MECTIQGCAPVISLQWGCCSWQLNDGWLISFRSSPKTQCRSMEDFLRLLYWNTFTPTSHTELFYINHTDWPLSLENGKRLVRRPAKLDDFSPNYIRVGSTSYTIPNLPRLKESFHHGFQDGKLFLHQNQLFLLLVCERVILPKLFLLPLDLEAIRQNQVVRQPAGNHSTFARQIVGRWAEGDGAQKNWMYVPTKTDDMYFVAELSPLHVVQILLDTHEAVTVYKSNHSWWAASGVSPLRGSSFFVRDGNSWLGVVYMRSPHMTGNFFPEYNSFVVRLERWRISAVSDGWRLPDHMTLTILAAHPNHPGHPPLPRLHYASALVDNGEEWLLVYGSMDCTSHVAHVPKQALRDLLRPINASHRTMYHYPAHNGQPEPNYWFEQSPVALDYQAFLLLLIVLLSLLLCRAFKKKDMNQRRLQPHNPQPLGIANDIQVRRGRIKFRNNVQDSNISLHNLKVTFEVAVVSQISLLVNHTMISHKNIGYTISSGVPQLQRAD
eukprot:g67323.t1